MIKISLNKFALSFCFIVLFFQFNAQVQLGNDILTELDNVRNSEYFGFCVSNSSDGKIVAIGDPLVEGGGIVRVYEYNAIDSIWAQKGQSIFGEYDKDRLGLALSLSSDGCRLAAGSKWNPENGRESGHVRIYEFDDFYNEWCQIGDDINGEHVVNGCGHSVALSDQGNIVAIGGMAYSGYDTTRGRVRVFEFKKGRWKQIGKDIHGESYNDLSGSSLSISGNGKILAIGAIGSKNGYVRIFELKNNKWLQKGKTIKGEVINYFYKIGESISLSQSGDILAVGSKFGKGCSRIYKFDSKSSEWIQLGQDISGEGASVDLSKDGNYLVIGRPNSQINDSKKGLAALYKFDKQKNFWKQIGNYMLGEKIREKRGKSVSISSNGLIVAIGGISGKVQVYDFTFMEKQ